MKKKNRKVIPINEGREGVTWTTPADANVFEDLGLPDADKLLAEAERRRELDEPGHQESPDQ